MRDRIEQQRDRLYLAGKVNHQMVSETEQERTSVLRAAPVNRVERKTARRWRDGEAQRPPEDVIAGEVAAIEHEQSPSRTGRKKCIKNSDTVIGTSCDIISSIRRLADERDSSTRWHPAAFRTSTKGQRQG